MINLFFVDNTNITEMILAIDIGNTNIVFGVCENNEWIHTWRTETSFEKTEASYEMILRSYFLESNLKISSVSAIALSSVVPPLSDVFRAMCLHFFGLEPVIVNAELYNRLKINVNNPNEIGSDLVANAVAAYELVNDYCIVVDFGTALTFTVLDDKGKILGVSIAPGLKTAMKSLSGSTAKLPEVKLEIPSSVIGSNTITALQSGVLLGYEGLVKNILLRIKEEIREDFYVISTGGLASILPSLRNEFNQNDPLLTLKGLKLILEQT